MTKSPIKLNLENLEDHMVFVEGGTFLMGSERFNNASPVHEVSIKDFYLSRTLVSNELWEEVMTENRSNFRHSHRPVERVSWYDAVKFCHQLSRRIGLNPYYEIFEDQVDTNNISGIDDQKWLVKVNPKANGYHLPTEAEWEYSARGGKYVRDLGFIGSNNLHEIAWHSSKSGNSHSISQPIAFKRSNSLGLFDMSGNLWEWCQDWFDVSYYQKCVDEGIIDNPRGPQSGARRVIRGGSWYDDGNEVFRPAFRNFGLPSIRDLDAGFRVSRY